MVETPWYVEAFRGDYRRVYPHRDLASAQREVEWLLSLGLEGRLLDLCCGFGRHSVALAQAGRSVVGLDLSADLLEGVAGLPGGKRLGGRLVRADARFLPFEPASFGAVLNLFSSFGYFGDEGDALVAAEVARVLAPGGIAVFDLMNPARIRAHLVPASETRRDGLVIVERRSLEAGGSRVVKEVELSLDDGRRRSWREDVRMYDPDEIAALLAAAGFDIVRTYGDFGPVDFSAEAERQLLVARRLD